MSDKSSDSASIQLIDTVTKLTDLEHVFPFQGAEGGEATHGALDFDSHSSDDDGDKWRVVAVDSEALSRNASICLIQVRTDRSTKLGFLHSKLKATCSRIHALSRFSTMCRCALRSSWRNWETKNSYSMEPLTLSRRPRHRLATSL